ncbi:MAG TPA: hypothetical protein VMA13_04935 [Candidatus Saccharimonadales bacterium]|nr:hypothetical protein [Candidatus Saccharimonadales bacterium]
MVGNREREEDLFFEALRQPDPVKRSVFLGRACVGKPALRARVEKLLAVQTEAERFFAEAKRATRIQMKAHQQQ